MRKPLPPATEYQHNNRYLFAPTLSTKPEKVETTADDAELRQILAEMLRQGNRPSFLSKNPLGRRLAAKLLEIETAERELRELATLATSFT